ncbi:outer membrane protein [Pleomorphomonas sp. JP5]|uniref:outer membrane protein n=1 Tax=Pleomorphomonas sp. JP5 TaxID=2942998 RepID=UPI0020435506|nr:outer membrane protein [Pleomorphomonas sp. JP5]MCM5557711.1 porin family protein [Pleomorphomonas sp. JP5]
MSKLLLGAVAGSALLLSAPAFAADLNEPIPQAPYAAPVASSTFDWTGAYVGANAGYSWANQASGVGKDHDAAVGGVFAGYNYQMPNNIVVGGEGEVAYGGADPLATWTGAIRGRAGYAFDNILVYGAVGGLVGQGEMKTGTGDQTRTHVGYQVGAGIEAALTTNVTARAEYLYTGTNSRDYNGGVKGDLDGNAVKVGIGYKF